MPFYPCRVGGVNGNASTAESFYLAVNESKSINLVAGANVIYIMSDLKDATTFFKTYINNTLVTQSIKNVFSNGNDWGASVGKLSGDFKKGDAVKFTPIAGVVHSIKMTVIAITEGE